MESCSLAPGLSSEPPGSLTLGHGAEELAAPELGARGESLESQSPGCLLAWVAMLHPHLLAGTIYVAYVCNTQGAHVEREEAKGWAPKAGTGLNVSKEMAQERPNPGNPLGLQAALEGVPQEPDCVWLEHTDRASGTSGVGGERQRSS